MAALGEAWMPGAVLSGGRYRVVADISAGATSTVLEAEDLTNGERRALKVVHADNTGRLRTPFKCVQREIESASALRHPNLARLLDVFAEGADLVMAWELIRGPDLLTLIQRSPDRRIPEPLAARLFQQLASAVAAMHGAGFCHRDLKPENAVVSAAAAAFDADSSSSTAASTLNALKVIDFGLARAVDAAATARVGTPEYMAPEMIAGGVLAAAVSSSSSEREDEREESGTGSARPSSSRRQQQQQQLPHDDDDDDGSTSSSSSGQRHRRSRRSRSSGRRGKLPAAAAAVAAAAATAADNEDHSPDLPPSTSTSTSSLTSSQRQAAARRLPYDGLAVDSWGLGVTLYVMLTGALPFRDRAHPRSLAHTLRSIVSGEPPRARPLAAAGVSPLAVDLVQALLVRDPSARLSAEEAARHPWVVEMTQRGGDKRKAEELERAAVKALATALEGYEWEAAHARPESLAAAEAVSVADAAGAASGAVGASASPSVSSDHGSDDIIIGDIYATEAAAAASAAAATATAASAVVAAAAATAAAEASHSNDSDTNSNASNPPVPRSSFEATNRQKALLSVQKSAFGSSASLANDAEAAEASVAATAAAVAAATAAVCNNFPSGGSSPRAPLPPAASLGLPPLSGGVATTLGPRRSSSGTSPRAAAAVVSAALVQQAAAAAAASGTALLTGALSGPPSSSPSRLASPAPSRAMSAGLAADELLGQGLTSWLSDLAAAEAPPDDGPFHSDDEDGDSDDEDVLSGSSTSSFEAAAAAGEDDDDNEKPPPSLNGGTSRSPEPDGAGKRPDEISEAVDAVSASAAAAPPARFQVPTPPNSGPLVPASAMPSPSHNHSGDLIGGAGGEGGTTNNESHYSYSYYDDAGGELGAECADDDPWLYGDDIVETPWGVSCGPSSHASASGPLSGGLSGPLSGSSWASGPGVAGGGGGTGAVAGQTSWYGSGAATTAVSLQQQQQLGQAQQQQAAPLSGGSSAGKEGGRLSHFDAPPDSGSSAATTAMTVGAVSLYSNDDASPPISGGLQGAAPEPEAEATAAAANAAAAPSDTIITKPGKRRGGLGVAATLAQLKAAAAVAPPPRGCGPLAHLRHCHALAAAATAAAHHHQVQGSGNGVPPSSTVTSAQSSSSDLTASVTSTTSPPRPPPARGGRAPRHNGGGASPPPPPAIARSLGKLVGGLRGGNSNGSNGGRPQPMFKIEQVPS